MRKLGRLLMVASLSIPAPLVAQGEGTALVGTWRSTRVGTHQSGGSATLNETLTLRADGTWTREWVLDGVAPFGTLRMEADGDWRVSGDSLWLNDPAKAGDSFPDASVNKFALRGQELTLVYKQRASAKLGTEVYKRVNPSQPLRFEKP